MENRTFRLEVGSYRIDLPDYATVSAEVHMPPDRAFGAAFTKWTVKLGRFLLFIHLSNDGLRGLKEFTDWTTKGNVVVQDICVNGIEGVTHGDYGPPRTWIDWWFKRGDLTICFCLQSASFPFAQPSEAETNEHDAIIRSITSMVGAGI